MLRYFMSRSSCVLSFFVFVTIGLVSQSVVAQDAPATSKDPAAIKAEQEEFQSVKSPLPYSAKSISRGKMIYARYCTECHGKDGKAQIDVVANATNLTNPEKFLHGITEGEIFHSIRDGAGVDMPPFKPMLTK